MRRACALAGLTLALCATGPAQAQDESDGGTRLERFLEEQLSDGDAFDVNLTGFRGALSANASLERLTISDEEGVWLILEDAELVWTRSALLRGRLDVDRLSAQRLQVLRPPRAPETGLHLPEAEATPFSLPQLPVWVEVDALSIAEVDLDQSVFGHAAQLSLEGSANLADGAGAARLEVIRLDGPAGVIDLDLDFDNASRELAVSLLVEEDGGGLIAEMLDIPDRPSVRLAVEGAGPFPGFAADIALTTDGVPRLQGEIITTSTAAAEDTEISVDIAGDISPLIQPDYRAFFGQSVDLSSHVMLFADGRIALDELSLSSAALRLEGAVFLDEGRRPERFDLTGRIANASGAEVRLPVPNADVTLEQVELDVRFDAGLGEAYRAELTVLGLDLEEISFAELGLDVTGNITESGGIVSAVTAEIGAVARGAQHADPALSTAMGETHAVRAHLDWQNDDPLRLRDLSYTGGDVRLSGSADIALAENRLDTQLELTAEISDLSRYSALAGQDLSGRLQGDLAGSAELLSGRFDLVLDGQGAELRLADAVPAALFAGETELGLAIRRDETGATLNYVHLANAELELTGRGRISATDGALRAEVDLADLGLFNEFVRGPAALDLSLTRQDSGPWDTLAEIEGPEGIEIQLSGALGLPNGAVDLRAAGSLPLALANVALAPRSIEGVLVFELALEGQPGLDGVRGSFRSQAARLALPTIQTSLSDIAIRADLANSLLTVTGSGGLSAGGTLQTDVQLNLGSPSLPVRADITGRDLRLIDPALYDARIDAADLSYVGSVAGGATLAGTITLGETEIRIPETGLGASAIPDIRHLGETAAQRQTRVAAGLTGGAGQGNSGGGTDIGLDLSVTAPGRLFIRGRGLDAELGGTLRLGGTSASLRPSGRFDLLRGRFSILGTRLDLAEGSATLQGRFDPFINLLATSRSGGFTIGIRVVGSASDPEISFSSEPSLPEDEVLAQLLFGRSVSNLSPVQLLQLADAAASLAGGPSDSGVFANLRDGLGLDDLDLQTDAQGNAAIRAGRYISSNIYTDLTIGADGDTDLSLNIDLTPDITARGSVSSDGESGLGLFFERDY